MSSVFAEANVTAYFNASGRQLGACMRPPDDPQPSTSQPHALGPEHTRPGRSVPPTTPLDYISKTTSRFLASRIIAGPRGLRSWDRGRTGVPISRSPPDRMNSSSTPFLNVEHYKCWLTHPNAGLLVRRRQSDSDPPRLPGRLPSEPPPSPSPPAPPRPLKCHRNPPPASRYLLLSKGVVVRGAFHSVRTGDRLLRMSIVAG